MLPADGKPNRFARMPFLCYLRVSMLWPFSKHISIILSRPRVSIYRYIKVTTNDRNAESTRMHLKRKFKLVSREMERYIKPSTFLRQCGIAYSCVLQNSIFYKENKYKYFNKYTFEKKKVPPRLRNDSQNSSYIFGD